MFGIVWSLVKSSSESSFGNRYLLQSRGEAASALLQSRSQEESSPHLARVLQRPPTRSWLHCTRERSWEQNTQLQQRSPTHPGSVSSPETSHLPIHVKRKYAILSNLSPVSIKTRIPSSHHPIPTPTDPTWCQCCITAMTATGRQHPTLTFYPSGLLLQRTDTEKSVQPHRRPLLFSSL